MKIIILKSMLVLMAVMFSSTVFAANSAPKLNDKEVKVKYVSGSALALEWEKAMDDNTLPEDLKYTVQWEAVGGASSTMRQQNDIDGMYIYGLYPNTDYFVYVSVEDAEGEYTSYAPLRVKTESGNSGNDSPTLSVGTLTVSDLCKSSMKVSWTHATDDNTRPENLAYWISYKANGETASKTEFVGFGKESVVLDKLVNSKRYSLTLTVYDEDGRSVMYQEKTANTNNASKSYDLWVKDIHVETDNASDVLKDGGSVIYNVKTSTLTLTNADIVGTGSTSSQNSGIYSKISGLTIRVKGECTVKNENYIALNLAYGATITSNDEDDVLNLASSSKWAAIQSGAADHDLVFAGHVEVRSSQYNSFIDKFKSVKFDDCIIRASGTGMFMTGVPNLIYNYDKLTRLIDYPRADVKLLTDKVYYLVNNDTEEIPISGSVLVAPTYGYAIDGVCIWEGNKVEMQGDGKDQPYYTDYRRLVLNDNAKMGSIDCYATGEGDYAAAISVNGTAYVNDITISGESGIVGGQSPYASDNHLVIKGNTMAAVSSKPLDCILRVERVCIRTEGQMYGFYGVDLRPRSSLIDIDATEDAIFQSNLFFAEDEMKIIVPENGYLFMGRIASGNYKYAKQAVIGLPGLYDDYLRWYKAEREIATGINVVDNLQNADDYNVMGVRVNDTYRGIVVRNGKKMLVK